MARHRDQRSGRRRPSRLALAALALAAILPVRSAQAQYIEGPRGPYGGPPPAYAEPGDARADRRAPPRRGERQPVGLNCAAVQQSISGPKPYSCPLPGARPLGARCFCDLPIAPFSPPQTAVGHVVP